MAKVQEYSKGLSNIMLIIKGCHYGFSLYLFALYLGTCTKQLPDL